MADLIPLAAKSLAAAEQAIDGSLDPGIRTGTTPLHFFTHHG